MNSETEFKQKIPVDFTFDSSILKVLVPMVIATIVLYVLCFKSPECKILIYLIWYIGLALLLLKNSTMVEITPSMIIIHRPIFDHIVINKKDIINTEVKKNTGFAFRWLIAISLFILTGFIAYNTFYNVIYSISGKTIFEGIIFVFNEFWMILLLIVILSVLFKRLPYPDLVKVSIDKSNAVFYSKEPEKLKKLIEVQEYA